MDLLKSRYLTLIQAVGEDYALDPDPVEELLNLGDFFDELEAVRVDLIHGLPQYNGKVGAGDVQKLTAERAVEWFWKIGFLLRFLLCVPENREEIMAIIPAKFPRIVRWGEYRDRGETIFFYEEEPDREGERFKTLLRQSYSYPYILQARHLHRGEYERMSLEEKRMEYTAFEGCSFRGVSFAGAAFLGPASWNAALRTAASGRRIWPWRGLRAASFRTWTGSGRVLRKRSVSQARRRDSVRSRKRKFW